MRESLLRLLAVYCSLPVARGSTTDGHGHDLEHSTVHAKDMEFGGGAINEKERTYDGPTNPIANPKRIESGGSEYNPFSSRAHLLHALEGLDRYPAYLSRWNNEDIESLENALEKRLEQVRSQKRTVLEKRGQFEKLTAKVIEADRNWIGFLTPASTWDEILSHILDPRAARVVKRYLQKNSSPSLQDVLIGKVHVDLDIGYLAELMDEELYDVYSFPLLSADFCSKLQGYVRAVAKMLQQESKEYSHLHSTIRDLDTIGLGWLNDILFHVILKPISSHLFQESEMMGRDLDWRQGYIAAYSASPSEAKPRQRLVPHTDDSEVTMNVCIGDDFTGGNLHFKGLRGTPRGGIDLVGEYKPQIGRAIVHAGRHFHEVSVVTAGDRFAYIMWSRSWNGVRASTCPCCWLNRRTDNNCACGKRWN